VALKKSADASSDAHAEEPAAASYEEPASEQPAAEETYAEPEQAAAED